MIVAPYSSKLIKAARKKLGLTQAVLAESTGIPRRRISALECGYQIPNDQEQTALCQRLGLSRERLALSAPSGPRPCCPDARKRFVSRYPFKVPRDRPSEIRYHAARKQYPALVSSLTQQIRALKGSDWASLYLRDACFDSSLEFIASLTLLAEGAEPCWVPPQNTGFTKLPVINPLDRSISGHHPYPALLWEGRFLFPQLTVLTRNATARLDLLMGIVDGGEPQWWDIEFDGPGHNSTYDAERESEIGLPVKRFLIYQILSGEFVNQLRLLGTSTQI